MILKKIDDEHQLENFIVNLPTKSIIFETLSFNSK